MLKYSFFLAVYNLILSLHLIISECARVVKLNVKCLIENRKFFLKLMQLENGMKTLTNLLKVTIVNLKNIKLKHRFFKIESFQENRRFKVYGFRLLFGYRITSKTFHTVKVNCLF